MILIEFFYVDFAIHAVHTNVRRKSVTNEKKPHLVTRVRNHGRVVGKEGGPGEGMFPNIVGYWQHRQRGGVRFGYYLRIA